jgi:hypothetical protein
VVGAIDFDGDVEWLRVEVCDSVMKRNLISELEVREVAVENETHQSFRESPWTLAEVLGEDFHLRNVF